MIYFDNETRQFSTVSDREFSKWSQKKKDRRKERIEMVKARQNYFENVGKSSYRRNMASNMKYMAGVGAAQGASMGLAADAATGGLSLGAGTALGAVGGAVTGALAGAIQKPVNKHIVAPIHGKYLKRLQKKYEKHKND